MKRRHERRAAIRLPVAAQFRDANGLAQQSFNGSCAESDDDFGPDQINLLVQVRNARRHFFRRRFTVAVTLAGRVRPAFQDVRNINIRARKSGRRNYFRQQLSRRPDERFALRIFIRARRFADEHKLRVNAPDAEHDVLARRREVRAFHARQRARL